MIYILIYSLVVMGPNSGTRLSGVQILAWSLIAE